MGELLRALPAVTAVRQEMEHYACRSASRTWPCRQSSSACVDHQLELASLTTRHASLEDVFVTLTGRHLRDDATS